MVYQLNMVENDYVVYNPGVYYKHIILAEFGHFN
jgi:hypothetical protein